MNTIYRNFSVFLLMVLCQLASAQDLDPTVVVDRAYEGKLIEVHKPSLEMAVPDTLMHFDLDFDYSVFESPYKGSYEFNPYLLSMKPSVSTDVAGKFYLRAGAGYQLRPELDAVWSPVIRNKALRLDVYATHRSYFGDCLTMKSSDDSYQNISGLGFLDSKAGVSVGYELEKSVLKADVGYYGNHRLLSGNAPRNYNAIDAAFSFASRDMHAMDKTVYKADMDFRIASDNGLSENNLNLAFALGAPLRKAGSLLVNLDVEQDGYTGLLEGSAAMMSLTPHYVYSKGRLHADLGLKISKVALDPSSTLFVCDVKEQVLFPDINIRYQLLANSLMAFAKVGGGNKIYSNACLIERNRFFDIVNGGREILGLDYGADMGVGVERISAQAGLEGHFGSEFSWNIHAGYADHASGLVDAANPRAGVFGVAYAPYKTWNATAGWMWKSESILTQASLTYQNAWGDAFGAQQDNFKPAEFTGNVSFEYNYSRRFFAGLDCEFSSERVCRDRTFVLPGYADLGVSAEYVTSRSMSFWLRGGNLLGMTIHHNSLFAVKGPYFTLGICLKL